MATATNKKPGKKPGKKPRSGLSLGARIFLLIALLLVLSLGFAVGVTWWLGNRIADRSADRSLAASRAVQNDVRIQRFQQLELISRLFSADSAFVSYIAEATAGGLDGAGNFDRDSIIDLLLERQSSLGFEFAILIDDQGRLVYRTDQPNAFGEDLSDSGLVASVFDDARPASGFWREGDKLYQAAAVPLLLGFDLYGILITGFAVDDDWAGEIKRVAGTDVAIVVAGEGGDSGRLAAAATTLDAARLDRLLDQLRQSPQLLRTVLEEGRAVPDHEFEIQGRQRAYIAPLQDASGNTVGATLGLISVEQELAGFRQIQRVLLIAGGLALLFALLLSYALSKRTLRPVQQLATAAEAAAQGDYGTEIAVRRRDEVGRLATAFSSLLSDLREKRDIESYLTDLSRHLPEQEVSEEVSSEAETRQVAILAVELRSYARPKLAREPAETVEKLIRDLRRISSIVTDKGGRVDSLSGHRLLARFEGPERSLHCLAAASAVVQRLSTPSNAFEEAMPPVVAVTAGDAVTGSVFLGSRTVPALVGLPLQQIDGLLREATPGDILLAPSIHTELRGSFEEAGVELAAMRGVLSTQPLYILRGEMAARVVQPTPRTHMPTSGDGAFRESQPTMVSVGPGAVLGDRFEILSVLGSGGMGVVYKARDRELGDLVALKTLKPEAWGDRELLDRLKSEIKLARRITHPNVLRTFDFGEIGGVAYISMEYVRGLTVRYLLEQTKQLPLSAGLRLARQLCAGLAAAHEVGILHRDIKPENLIIDPTGNAKLMDFGIARPIRRPTTGSLHQTKAGHILGTPHYLAPEQIQGQEPDPRWDIYACGVVFYEIFTGGLPFSGDNPMQIVLKHLNEEPEAPSVRWPGIPRELELLILRCLAKDPTQRFASARQLLEALEDLRA